MDRKMTTEFDAFRSVDFNWTRQLKSIWRDPPYHVASLHQARLDDLVDYFTRNTRELDPADEPLGRVIVGPAGYGKTHLIGELRRRIWEMEGWFVLLDFVGIKDFWSSVALGFLNSLQVRMPDGRMQYDWLFLKLTDEIGREQEVIAIANRWRGQAREFATELAQLFVQSLSRLHFQETSAHRDVVTALILLISDDLDCHSIAHAWLQGMNLDAADLRPLRLLGQNDPIKVVQGLSWIMSLVGPTLIAVDQIDAIVSASNSLARTTNSGAKQEQEEAQSIVDSLAEGLMDLHEKKHRAVTVVSCLEATWKVLQDKTTVAVTDRYGSPAILHALPNGDIAKCLVAARLYQAYSSSGFKPAYPTWPFTQTAFESAVGFSPRQLFKACEEHRQHCVGDGKVTECGTFGSAEPRPEPEPPKPDRFNEAYDGEIRAAEVAGFMDIEGEDRLHALLDATLSLFKKHLDLLDDIDVDVQRDPDQMRPSLHGRLFFTFHSEGDREQHYCFRILGHTNAIAFQARLRAAMTASGIDRALTFRHLFILRRGDPPGGPRTQALVAQFTKAGGRFIAPTDDDLRAFVALQAMARRDLPGFDAWLRARKPLFDTSLFWAAGLCPPPFLAGSGPRGEGEAAPPGPARPGGGARPTEAREGESRETKSRESKSRESEETATGTGQRAGAARSIPVGRRFERGTLGDPILLDADLLPRHTVILAGPGSGKTVLLRRLVEEAALRGIPSVVVDISNDLSRLGDPWPARPEAFSDADAAAAAAYHARVNVVIWTPGVSSGNPVSLNLLPDFAAIGTQPDNQTEDERGQAVEMARATLSAYLTGTGQKASLKHGVLADALRAFAKRGGGSLGDLIGLLSELPEDASKIGDAPKLAGDIANQLLAAIATNPLLQAAGTSLDPQRLFHGTDGRTRISVINLAGLGGEDARQSFVNQLQMMLFTWIKQHPSPAGRLYVLDEAQNFVPSLAGTACKASALSLAAQARKYGLGMILATQLPKGIDNAAVSNCTTHIYGRMSSPATIQATKDLMAAKGGAADDIGRLAKGEFYFSTEGFNRPIKIHTSLCLSWHPPNPPTAEEVIAKARATMD
jgi:DNA replication protein DnaC